jgi:hypothetical protein
MNELQPRRQQQQPLEYIAAMTAGSEPYYGTTSRSSRPVSWHPSSHLQPQAHAYHHTAYPLSTPSMHADAQEMFSQPQFSPMMPSYSNNTSPCSTFSPLPLSTYYGTDNGFPFASGRPDMDQRSLTLFTGRHDGQVPEACPGLSAGTHQASPDTLDWNAFVMHGFNNTSPPTPDSFLPTQQTQAALTQEAPGLVEAEEDDGEVLVGMGLYDQPEKYQEDPHLNNYRSTVSALLGSGYQAREPQGKGLKLEETWEPPKSESGDEDDDEEEDDDEDAEA